MRRVRKILFWLVVLVVIVYGVGFLLPNSAHVEREITIKSTPEEVFPLVSEFASFNQWSPWLQRDPNTKITFEGPETGVGARMIWSSEHPQVGSGSQEIIDIEPSRLLRTQLDFGDMGTATSSFTLEDIAEGSRVIWGFDTHFGNDIMGRYMGLMFDRWIGPDYEAGLQNLKALAEGRS